MTQDQKTTENQKVTEDHRSKDQETTDNKKYVRSYYSLRKTVGIIGIAFPFALLFISYCLEKEIASSISQYYHYNHLSRDIFVLVMSTIGIFMFFYVGHTKDAAWEFDNILSNLAAIFAFGTALFPTTPKGTEVDITQHVPNFTGWIHNVSAVLLFACFIIFSWYRFTKSDTPKEEMGTEKRIRNTIYRVCAIIMAVSLLFIIVIFFIDTGKVPFFNTLSSDWKIIFWLEALLLYAFGFAWLVKGKAILKDKK